MSKKMKIKLLKKWNKITIAKRITILYGAIFSFAIIVISILIFKNASSFNQSLVKEEFLKTYNNIEDYIKENGTINDNDIQELLSNKYVEVQIINMDTNEIAENLVGNPMPALFPNPTDIRGHKISDDENVRNERHYPENIDELRKPKDFNIDKKMDYTIRTFQGHEFISMSNMTEINGTKYMILLYKMLTNDGYYMGQIALRLFFMDLICIFMAFAIGRYISKVMLKPVERIRETAEIISIEDLSKRIDVSGADDEIKDLSITFNSMIERLEESFKKQNQFISDASHELKTPISVIQGYANLINRWGKSDPNVLQESIESIIAETEHMSTLIKKLLFLAKSDQNKMNVQKRKVFLDDLVREVIKEIDIMGVEREIIYNELDKTEVFADADLIKQLLWIYTENAIKYTKNNGIIIFKVYNDKKYGYVSIGDNGLGIDEEDIKRIFDRFYRADKSRNKEIPGTGLGLSIANWIAKVNDIKILVESTKGEGTTFINRFKLYKDEKFNNIVDKERIV